MRSNPRCVFDTNVLVSALLLDAGNPAQAFFTVLRDGEVIVSADVISEVSEVLGRKKFRRYVTEDQRERFLQGLLREATLVEIQETVQACRDPKDDKFLELAVNGGADCIVSGDEDLLVLRSFRGVDILSPSDFLDAIAISKPEPDSRNNNPAKKPNAPARIA